MGGFAQFVWNSETKKLCGRTGRSWCEIAVYYMFYYIALTAFYSSSICAFYWMISANEPRLLLTNAVHDGNPGMGYRPLFPELHTTLIHRSKVMQKFNAKSINDYFDEEEIVVTTDEKERDPPCVGDVCPINIWEPHMGNCTNKNNYGYTYTTKGGKHGTPCVLIKLNKLFDWQPEMIDKKPEDDFDKIDDPATFLKDYIPISCRGESAVDKENIIDIKYYPKQGLPKKHFPYKNQRSPEVYQSPFVFAQIKTTPGVVVYVECLAYAKNIEYVGDTQETRKGSVHFELLADE